MYPTRAPHERGGELAMDVMVESPLWNEVPDAAAVVRRAIEAAAQPLAGRAEVAIVLTDDEAIRALNRRWRGRDAATNVLSFPSPGVLPSSAAPRALGDIVIAFETARREAQGEAKPLLDHVSHLAIHGFLHLLGYDHESEEEAETMERVERDILARLGVPDPYAPREADHERHA
jgi:probable rRNA maturation factor